MKRDPVGSWLAKVESDWTVVEILTASEHCPADAVCFHCQQYAEKLLKTLLTLNGMESPKTHDLRRLIQMAKPFAAELAEIEDQVDVLTGYGVSARYPDDGWALERVDVDEAVELARRIGGVVRPRLASHRESQ